MGEQRRWGNRELTAKAPDQDSPEPLRWKLDGRLAGAAGKPIDADPAPGARLGTAQPLLEANSG